MHRRWKSLRDCYRRELQKQTSQKSGSAATGRKCYVYFEQLRFLQTVCSPTQSGLGEIENEVPDMQNEQNENREYVEPEVPSATPKKRSRISKDDDAELIKVLKQKVAQEASFSLSANNDRDPDTLFMLSLVPDLKKVPENKKLIIKTQLMNTILQAQQSSALTMITAPAHLGDSQPSAMQASSQSTYTNLHLQGSASRTLPVHPAHSQQTAMQAWRQSSYTDLSPQPQTSATLMIAPVHSGQYQPNEMLACNRATHTVLSSSNASQGSSRESMSPDSVYSADSFPYFLDRSHQD